MSAATFSNFSTHSISESSFRTHRASELASAELDTTVRIAGWLQRKRALGSVLFVDVRDASGVVQCVVDRGSPCFSVLERLRPETVVQVAGQLLSRAPEAFNPKLETGAVEIAVHDVAVLGGCAPLPFSVLGKDEAPEALRLEYRFLDLRRERLRRNIVLRSRVIQRLRELMVERGFLEIQTPILTASSPEGARDFLVPSRRYPGKFYALPQAPQMFKQLLMVAGFERYFQIAPCFRDEDARADRSPGEFYQLDLEMAFVTQEEVFATVEPVLCTLFQEFSSLPVSELPFLRITFRDASARFATDKPDLRAELEFAEVTSALTASRVFSDFEAQRLRALRLPGAIERGRSYFDRLSARCSSEGELKTGWFSVGSARGTLARLSEPARQLCIEATGAGEGDVVLLFGSATPAAERSLAELRVELSQQFGLYRDSEYRFCWIVDYPMYERDRETDRIVFSHNPFSMPQGGLAGLDGNPESVLAYQYDLVCNGVELSSGAIRNHSPDIMLRAFAIAGYDPTEVEQRFGGLFRAFQYGAPPHGGLAPGIDRIVMLLLQEPNLREVVAFPMTQNGEDLLVGAPAAVSDAQLEAVHVSVARAADELRLELPSYAFRESYLKMVDEFCVAGEGDSWPHGHSGPPDVRATTDFAAYLRRVRDVSAGENLPDGHVPATTFWLVAGDEVLGTASLRHALNDFLRQEGGHLGYCIRPSRRGQGLMKRFAQLLLQQARTRGLSELLVTCDDANTASARVIESMGGRLERTFVSDRLEPGTLCRRYIVPLESNADRQD